MATKTGAIRSALGPLKYHVGEKIKYAKALVDEAIPDDAEEIASMIDRLELSHANLDTGLNKYMSKHEEWSTKVDELEDPELQEKEQGLFDAKVQEHGDLVDSAYDAANRINLRLRKLLDLQNRAAGQNSAANTPARSSVHSSRNSYPVKPPRLSLPTFKGDYLEWEQFWSMFESNIHARNDMTETEKHTCLLSHLNGPAKEVVTGIPVMNGNYQIAIDLLKDRFDRAATLIVPMLFAEFQKMPPSDKKMTSKMKTFDACERIFRQLQMAGEDINQGRGLTGTLLSKFPVGMIHDLELRIYTRDAIKKLLKRQETTFSLLDEVQAIRNLSTGETGKAKGTVDKPNKDYEATADKAKSYTDSSFAAVASSGSSRKPNWRPKGAPAPNSMGAQAITPASACYFCGDKHFNGSCPMYPTATSRFRRAQQLGRCPRCLRYHQGLCWTNIKCIHCRTDNQHYSALCPQQFPDQQTGNPASSSLFGHSLPAGVTYGSGPVGASVGTGTPTVPATITAIPPVTAVPLSMPEVPTVQPTPPTSSSSAITGMTGLNHPKRKAALFQTAKTTVFNPATGHCCLMRLVMDTLSSRTYVREGAARRLGLLGKNSDNLYVTVFGTNKQVPVATQQVNFDIALQNGEKIELTANTTKVICASRVLPTGWTELERTILHENQQNLADDPFDDDASVDILIGADYVWEFMLGQRITTQSSTMFFVPSGLGLMIAGTSEFQDDTTSLLTMLCITEVTSNFPAELGLAATIEPKFEKPIPDINEYWDLEKIGITDDPIVNEDDVAYDKFQRTVTFDEGRYQVQLPWIDEKKSVLPTNYEVAYDRFRSLNKRLQKNPELLQGYRDILELQHERGIIEKVPTEEIETSNAVHYLPHHPVVKPSSATTKIRIVFDAAAKRNRDSPSLNECLLRGPVILPDLCQMLMRMRTCKTVVISDIEKAFLQVGLQPIDRDVTRFLWFKDAENPRLQDNVEVWRYGRVNFGVICSPFLLAATLDHHLSQENTDFAESLRKDIYVDNVISGLNGDDDPVEYYHDLKALFNRAGMNIQEFCSNSHELMTSIPERDRVKAADVKVLGLKWDSANHDSLRLVPSSKIRDAVNADAVTKRLILQALASIFDPLGWFQPALFPAKMLLHRLWDLKLGWDDPVNDELRKEWEALRASFSKIFDHRLKRCVGQDAADSTLAVFSDASGKAYATAVYLRVRTSDGSWTSHLIFAKSRLAPSSRKSKTGQTKINLPRLELLGAVIGARAAQFCRGAFHRPDMHVDFFIDSQCVLHWLRKRGYLKRFVAGRIDEIHKVSNCTFRFTMSLLSRTRRTTVPEGC